MARHSQSRKPAKRRTTLTLPSDSLQAAEKLARSRKVNLSTVIAEALDEGLRSKLSPSRAQQVLDAYRQAFSGFTDEEALILDGVILERRPEN